MRAQFSKLQVSNERLSQQFDALQQHVSREETLKAAFEDYKRQQDQMVEQRCAEMDARLDAMAYILMKSSLQSLKDLKLPLLDQLKGLNDAPMDVIMASLYLEDDTGDDAPQFIPRALWARSPRPLGLQPAYAADHAPGNMVFDYSGIIINCITASVPYVREKGVSPWLDLTIVLWAQRTWGSSSTQFLFPSPRRALMPSSRLLFALSTSPELFSVVRDYFSWNTEATYNVVPYKFLHLSAVRHKPFKDWCDKLNITQHFASVKHPQSNGLVERANRSLGEGIKARLGEGNKNWVEELPHVLWAHRTMVKSSHGDTPFSLTYGTEAVIPEEIRMPTYRNTTVDAVNNDEELRLNLDLLEERRERAAINEARSKSKMTKYYNSRVRSVAFQPGDFVYHSNDASHAAAGGKLGLKWEGPYDVTDALGNGAYKLRSMEGTTLPRTSNVTNLKRCDPEDHVKIFQAAAQVERWAMPTWCHMFNSTLIGAARVWFDELPPESIDGYKDMKAAFLSYFMQQKKYIKDPVEIHNIKQRDGETLEDFMERFKVETEGTKGAPECMRISGFMH
uniref:Reverse transcriptase domain-containing protein n=1 Tax=Tanacetum cinerariifolium TaxID=118510 RepID=A0A6L2LBJ2_TANCI|nr:reverse transcriptase domain-containing protein [Tanacetum cinerariifolium]